MSTLTTTVTATQTTEIELRPAVRRELKARLAIAAGLAHQIKTLTAELEEEKAAVETLLVDAGEGNALLAGVSVDGYRARLICGTSSHLNKKRLMELGCTPAMLEAATEIRPSKPYVKLTPPTDRD